MPIRYTVPELDEPEEESEPQPASARAPTIASAVIPRSGFVMSGPSDPLSPSLDHRVGVDGAIAMGLTNLPRIGACPRADPSRAAFHGKRWAIPGGRRVQALDARSGSRRAAVGVEPVLDAPGRRREMGRIDRTAATHA
ncbi:hypothetical protein GCM10009785_34410 [Brooklawnia cerclae]